MLYFKKNFYVELANAAFTHTGLTIRNRKETLIKVVSFYQERPLSFNPFFFPFYIEDDRITSSMAVYHSTIFWPA